MRRSSLLFLIFAALLILSQLALPLFMKSASLNKVASHSQKVELAIDSQVTAVKVEADGMNLKVSVDPSRRSPLIKADNDNIAIEYVDSTATLVLRSHQSTNKDGEVTLILPAHTLSIVSGLTHGVFIADKIEASNFILSPTPAHILMGEAKIDTLILAAAPADYESVSLTAGKSYIGELITAIAPENLELTLGKSRIGSITQVDEPEK